MSTSIEPSEAHSARASWLPWRSAPWPRWRIWVRQLVQVLAWPTGAALLLSLQFLIQPWVWANWSVADVLWAWSEVLRDRLIVALAIALAVASALPPRGAPLPVRAMVLAAAIALGAVGGELLLRHLDDRPHPALAGVAARWVIVALAVAGMFVLWRHAVEVRMRWQSEALQRLRGQQQLARAQLAALKHQIEPHFLFNTLATVRRLQRTDAAAGAAMLAHFIDYLRRSLPMLDSPQVPLAQELELLRAYLAVVAVRMSGRLRSDIDVPDALLAVPVPPLVLATLVENAVQHGLAPAADGGLLRISARQSGKQVEIAVEDTGVGFGSGGSSGSGIGLVNARARLRTLHGSAASLRLEANTPHGVRAVVTLPAGGASGSVV